MRTFRPRCLILGMLLAWIVALYVPSFLLAATGVVAAPDGILAATWMLPDQISFTAKAALSLAIAAFLLASRKIPLSPNARNIADALLGAAAMALVLMLLPESWSRGIGIGLTGQRFDPAAFPLYLIGGALAGLAFTLADRKCGELRTQD